jgi:hypothetical protein
VALGVILGLMLLGLGELIRRWHALPQPGTTVLAQLTSGAIGHGVLFYIIQLITLMLLALAANTSFGGLPVLAGLLARDNYLPHVFGLRADRRVFRYGVGFLAVAAALLLIVAQGTPRRLSLSSPSVYSSGSRSPRSGWCATGSRPAALASAVRR